MRKVLILGGTRDARETADLLVEKGFDVTTSLAGVTQEPMLPKGAIHRGGFGGADGLRSFIRAQLFDAVIDATHPFAEQISRNLVLALDDLTVQHLRIARAPWAQRPQDQWITVRSMADAAAILPAGAHVFLTIGRKDVAPFVARSDISGTIRCIEKPAANLNEKWVLLRARPSTSVAAEMKLMRESDFTHLVSKNAGGESAYAKIDACTELSIPVVMIAPPTKTGGTVCDDAAAVLAQLAI